MVQTVITYLLVALAAAWVAWSQLMPTATKRALKARFAPQKSVPSAKSGCDCGGDGGCH